ncbi:MAG: hypothetical protein HY247_04115 [archaeon]|nr:MAG: hypothetical protein HY247_04115 [archaeon]
MATATEGVYFNGAQTQTHGPLVDKVIISVYTTEGGMQGAVAAGTIQAPEWTFSTGAYTSLGSNPDVIENSTVSYSWFGIAFNTLKFPGSNVHYRRAIQDLQDYSYIQATILNGVEGTASPDVLPCAAYGAACQPMDGSNSSVRSYSLNLTAAASELLQAGLFCDGCTASTANSSTLWFKDAGHTLPFSPDLWRRTTHHRNPWGARTSFEASQIGLSFNNHLVGGGGAQANCFLPNAAEVTTPGSYNSGTGGNNPQVTNGTAITADHCDMLTFGFISGPAFNGNLQEYNSQFSGIPTNTMNYDDQSSTVTNATHVNINVATNKVLLAPDAATANRWAKNFAIGYSQQLPTVMGYFENELFADNSNGWTGYANLATQSPNDLTGLFYTLLNVHKCGSSTCDLDTSYPFTANAGVVGGTFKLALQQVSDQDGLFPLYNTNWVWQADVYGSIYDTALATPPSQTNVVNAFMDYMTTSHSIVGFSGMTPGGKAEFNYQQLKGAGQHTAQNIVSGQKITLNFANNITFYDQIPFTATDYQFSLDFTNVAASPNYPDSASPFSGIAGGSAGLIASVVTSKYSIDIYLNSSSFWNLPNVLVPVFPQHMWKYFNTDHVSTLLSTVDTTKSFFFVNAYSTQNAPKAPKWIFFLNNLEVGSGPFWLKSWDTPTGTGEIDRNPYYFRTAWDSNVSANSVAVGTPFLFSTALYMPIFNPTASAYCGVASGATGTCQVKGTNPGQSWASLGKAVGVYTAAGALVKKYNLAKNTGTGIYSASIPTALLAPGNYKIVVSTTYTFQGLKRTWYQASGFNVH